MPDNRPIFDFKYRYRFQKNDIGRALHFGARQRVYDEVWFVSRKNLLNIKQLKQHFYLVEYEMAALY